MFIVWLVCTLMKLMVSMVTLLLVKSSVVNDFIFLRVSVSRIM